VDLKNSRTDIFKQNAKWLTLFLLFSFVSSKAQFYTGSRMEFGKNRIKYEQFFWTFYSYERYDVYFYEEGRELANYVSKAAKKQITEVEKLFDYSFDGKLQFLVYNKQSDFKQSNIGLSTEEEYNTGGTTRIVGTKICLYFEGDHSKLDAQIRAGVAQVLVDQMMYGGNMREMLKNNTLLNLPEWYSKGLTDYVATDWNSDIDNRVKDGIISGRYNNINRLEGQDAVIAGHALWKYIADNYGEAVISNIVYMTKVSRNIDNSALFVLGISIKNLWRECLESYQNKYDEKDKSKTLPEQTLIPVKAKKKPRVYAQLKVSPDGNYAIYTTNEMGQMKIWLYDFQTQKTKRIFKSGQKIDRINDYSYPLLAWHPSGKLFSYIIERKGYLVMTTYELETKDKTERNIIGFEKILDYSYNDDGKKFVMSAVQKGQTDIFVFTSASNGYEQITKDIYDDLNPRFANNSSKIVFASNRPVDTLFFDPKRKMEEPLKYKDIYAFDNVTKSRTLIRVTNTPNINESNPTDYDKDHISFLSDMNGIRNRYFATFDSTIAYVDTAAHYKAIATYFPITNYSRNIIEHDISPKANKFTEIIFENGKYKMFVEPLAAAEALNPMTLQNTSYRDYKNRLDKKEQVEKDAKEKGINETPKLENVKTVISISDNNKQTKKDSAEVDINNFTFDKENKKAEPKKQPENQQVKTIATDSTVAKPADDFVLAKQRNYNTSFSVDYVVSQLDNSFLNATYQKFTGGGGPVYLNPGLNAFFKIAISDLFEDYRLTGGMRFSGNLNSNEYFVSYENRMGVWDKQVVLHRQSLLNVVGNSSLIKLHTHDVRYTVKYPFTEVASFRASLMYRNDRTIFTATDYNNLAKKDAYENWGTLKLEYVYDNVRKRGLNLYNGLRGKFFGEYYRQIDKDETDFFVLGMDWRYYKKIHRDFIWANRIAASTSFGNKKLIYYMGGVDNWFTPRFDNTTNIATDQNYAYQTLATPMRGFYQNARNGNSFAVINSELRFPIFKYLYQRPIRSDFVQNFQIIGFGDIGTAWTGADPFSDKNSLNTTIIGSSATPLVVTLKTQHNPIIGGYGIGIRSRLFGYFVRLDRAWGVQDGIILKPMWHLSFSLDF
jgi:hypothetical protein